jgi:hypothetical protein
MEREDLAPERIGLAPSTPITVRGRDGRPVQERVAYQHADRIYTGWATGEAFVIENDRGVSWELGWDTEDAKAFAAQLLLQAS